MPAPRNPREVHYSPRVVAYYPRARHPALLIIGEAPGPRGADRTGFPFWGDDCGRDLYGLVQQLGLLSEPFDAPARRADLQGTHPPSGHYAITNACPQMPIGSDGRFTAPEPARIEREAARLAQEIHELGPQAVLACGKAAAFGLAQAAQVLGEAPPPLLRGRMPSLQLVRAMEELVDHSWSVGGARAFVTCHPARNQWSPHSPTGRLHARIVEALQSAVTAPSSA